MSGRTYRSDVTDLEVYDFYFTGIEKIFASYGSRIIVLFMPRRHDENPDRFLKEALAAHPGIIFVNGMEAINRYEIPTGEYQARHPQPPAHLAYAREILEKIRE